jgi:hypothetical protein
VTLIPQLSLWQEILLLALAFVSLVYVFYFRIWVAIAAGSDLIFTGALAIAIASIAIPVLFDHLSAEVVDRSALPEALVTADEKVAAIEALPSELIARALTKLGYEPDPADAVPVPLELTPGPFESRIRPAVEALVATVLRAASLFTATVLLLMALALRSATATTRVLQSLSKRTEALEATLAKTSKASATPPEQAEAG